MNFSTKVEIAKPDIFIDHQSTIMMFGSCFVENMGELLAQNKFRVNLNPFGILYNPVSISQSLDIIINNRKFTSEDIFEDRGIYSSLYHHSRFSDLDKDRCLSNINDAIERAVNELPDTDILLVTFGTSYVYKLKENSQIVGNCHKLPASRFDRFRLSVEEIVSVWESLIENLKTINPKLKIIFTVSPIRHLKDGAHENQLSKATLLLAIDTLCRMNADISYFPSYEIVLDELRDYRFYNEDMVHPTPVAVKYIWQRFRETYFSDATCRIIDEWSKIASAIDHRPFNSNSDEHKHFLRQTLLKLRTFEQKYPYICLEKELKILQNRIDD